MIGAGACSRLRSVEELTLVGAFIDRVELRSGCAAGEVSFTATGDHRGRRR